MSVPSPRQGAPSRAALGFIALSVCLDYLSQSIAFPILPRLAQHLLGGDLASAARWSGMLEVAWAIPQFLAAPLLGALADRFGRRPVIVLSVFGVGLELVMNALAPNIGWLLAGRALCGISCGGQAAALAYVADVTPPDQRTAGYGLLSAAMWTGIIMGPALGGALAVIGIRAPFWAGAAVALVGGVYGAFVLPESLPPERRAPLVWRRANPWGAVDLLLRRPGLLALGFAQLLIWLAFQGTSNMTVLYTAFRYGWTPLSFGVFATALAATGIVVQAGLAGRIARWLGERRTLLAGRFGRAGDRHGRHASRPRAHRRPVLGGEPRRRPRPDRRPGAAVDHERQGRPGRTRPAAGRDRLDLQPDQRDRPDRLHPGLRLERSIAPGRAASWSGATLLAEGAALTLAAWALVFAFSARAALPRAATTTN